MVYLVLLLAFVVGLTPVTPLTSQVSSIASCYEKDGREISSCTRCNWLPDCFWCMDPKQNTQLAVGCVKRGSPCQKSLLPMDKGRVTETIPQNDNRRISPKGISVIVNPALETDIKFTAKLINNPVDIYFILDLSRTMEDHKQNLRNAARAISQKISNLTSDFQLGFGSFSDKPMPPFGKPNSTTYSFRHHVTLTKSTEEFSKKVYETAKVSNVDHPESGLEGLMQAIACKRVIGWRDGVRRVILLITDQDSHIALDGGLGGLYLPMEDSCKMEYSQAAKAYNYIDQLKNDYPSLGQIKNAMSKNEMPAVIFAVTKSLQKFYSEGTELVGILTKEASSIEEIVTQQYKAIKSRIAIRFDFDPLKMKVSLTSNCSESKLPESMKNIIKCENVQEVETISFISPVRPLESACIDQLETGLDFVSSGIYAVDGFSQDVLSVNLTCEKCDCQDVEINSKECWKRGNLACGGCECQKGYAGRNCECDLSQIGGDFNIQCKNPNTGQLCNGNGNCKCGICNCNFNYLGRQCECKIDKCLSKDLKVCSGHGSCQCDNGEAQCDCDDDYEGEYCDCPKKQDTCIDKLTGTVCNDNGKCECGKCKCDSDSEGQFCQTIKSFDVCSKLSPCVLAQQFRANVSSKTLEGWESECLKHTSRNGHNLFQTPPRVACHLSKKEHNDFGNITETSHYIESTNHQSCYHLQSANNDDNENDYKVLTISLSNFKYCQVQYEKCKILFYHENIEEDAIFNGEKELGKVYVIQHNATEDGIFTPLTQCTYLPMAVVIGSTVGLLLIVFVIVLVMALVFINIRDRNAWLKYLEMKADNEARLGQFQNPLYQDLTMTNIQNPAFGMIES